MEVSEVKIKRDEQVIDELVGNIYKKFRKPQNQAKGGWLDLSTPELVKFLHTELEELLESVTTLEYDNTFPEAADVAIYAAFIADPERIKAELAKRIFQ